MIFDIDGVLADTEALDVSVTTRVFAELFGLHNVVRKVFSAGIGCAAEEYVELAFSRATGARHGIVGECSHKGI